MREMGMVNRRALVPGMAAVFSWSFNSLGDVGGQVERKGLCPWQLWQKALHFEVLCHEALSDFKSHETLLGACLVEPLVVDSV